MTAKKNFFFQNLESGSASEFWRAARLLDNHKTYLPNLVNGSDVVSNDGEKAELLNAIFVNSFNKDVLPLGSSPPPFLSTLRISDLEDLLCSEEEVRYLLASIDPTKSSGSGAIAGRMLKSTASEIAPAVMKLFNKSLTSGMLPTDWKTA